MLDTYGNMPELDLGEFARPHVSRKIRAEQKLMQAGRPGKDSAEYRAWLEDRNAYNRNRRHERKRLYALLHRAQELCEQGRVPQALVDACRVKINIFNRLLPDGTVPPKRLQAKARAERTAMRKEQKQNYILQARARYEEEPSRGNAEALARATRGYGHPLTRYGTPLSAHQQNIQDNNLRQKLKRQEQYAARIRAAEEAARASERDADIREMRRDERGGLRLP